MLTRAARLTWLIVGLLALALGAIDNWQQHAAISRRTKVVSVISMIAVLAISLAMAAPPVVIIAQLVVLGAAALFILSRPEPPDL